MNVVKLVKTKSWNKSVQTDSDRDEEDNYTDKMQSREENIQTYSDDSEENELNIFDPLYIPKKSKINTHNVVTTHAKRNTDADNTDETLCALRRLFKQMEQKK